MTDAPKNESDLERFLYNTDDQTHDERVSELEQAGIDMAQFFANVERTVEEQYRIQLNKLAETELSARKRETKRLPGLETMSRELMLVSFASFREGKLGQDYKEAALARCREKDAAELSDEELRSWLSDIAEINDSDTKNDDGNE